MKAFFKCSGAVAIVLIMTAMSSLSAAEPVPTSETRLLLLRNGHVLQGDVRALGDRFQVQLTTGSEVRVAANDVDCVCRNWDEAYAAKLKGAEHRGVLGQVDLAEWCLRHKLIEQARETIATLQRSQNNHPRIAVLERRLKAHDSPPPPTTQVSPISSTVATVDDLDKMLRDLPTGAIETFTTTVQPLLIHRCGANGCHGTTSTSELRLLRPANGQTLTRRYTQRNLHSTLTMIDRDSPAHSRLLTAIKKPHGTAQAPIFTEREAAIAKQLTDWVLAVTKPQRSLQPNNLASFAEQLHQTTGSATRDLDQASHDAATNPPDESDSATNAADDPDSPPRFLRRTNQPKIENEKRKALPKLFVPRDPFDPELFNRRFHKPSADSEE